MSTCNHLVLLARLSPSVAGMGDGDALALLRSSLADVIAVQPLTGEGTLPDFGHAFSYDHSRFGDVSGMAVVDGVARVGVHTQNLSWPHREVDHDAPCGAEVESRLDVVLRRFSRLTTGVPGEVVGSVSNEHMDDFHEDGGRPIIRCRDGVAREAHVRFEGRHATYVDHRGDRPIEVVPLPEVIPADALTPDDGARLSVTVDGDGLLRRFEPLQGVDVGGHLLPR